MSTVERAISLNMVDRKCGNAWKDLGPMCWRDVALAVQASSASYGTPKGPACESPEAGVVKKFAMDLRYPFPGSNASLEWADLWHEIKAGGGCKHSVLVDETTTCTQVWVCAMHTADGKPRVYCSFRGTSSAQDAKTDMEFRKLRGAELKPLSDAWKHLTESEINGCAFHRGFYGQYSAVAAAVREEIEKGAVLLGASYELIVCGHSMGGALAKICVNMPLRSPRQRVCQA
jgi:hypothetical protein